jgi:Herpesvirus tegument protein, N-terminal conserved region
LEHATEKYKHEECIIHDIVFDINFIDTQVEEQNIMWHQFECIGSGHWMIRASLSQCDSIFSIENRNNQDVPNCIAALTIVQICAPSNWNATLLDVVLKYGDRLYTKSIDNARKDDPQLLALGNKRINPYQVVNAFTMLDYQITTNVALHSYGDITLKHPSELVNNLNDAVNEFLSNSSWFGILEAKNYYVAIWQQDDSLYMFDPHTIGPDGKWKTNGMACLSRFDDIDCMVSSYLGNLDYSNGTNYFNLYKVSF